MKEPGGGGAREDSRECCSTGGLIERGKRVRNQRIRGKTERQRKKKTLLAGGGRPKRTKHLVPTGKDIAPMKKKKQPTLKDYNGSHRAATEKKRSGGGGENG